MVSPETKYVQIIEADLEVYINILYTHMFLHKNICNNNHCGRRSYQFEIEGGGKEGGGWRALEWVEGRKRKEENDVITH